MQLMYWIFFGILLILWLFYYGKCELLKQEKKVLNKKIKDMKSIRNRIELMQIKELIDEYRKDKLGSNAYTVLAKISDIIIKTASVDTQND